MALLVVSTQVENAETRIQHLHTRTLLNDEEQGFRLPHADREQKREEGSLSTRACFVVVWTLLDIFLFMRQGNGLGGASPPRFLQSERWD